ncbi:hypothetical protein ACIGO9_29970 [Nocardia asteroides]|uniref:hypothetical protein n=1 Tax=Nocardia asteroides TaxID=1824 RepID=UPI0037C8A64F
MTTSNSRISTPVGPIEVDPELAQRYLTLAESTDPVAVTGAAAIRARLHDPDAPLPDSATVDQQDRLRAALPDTVLAHLDADRAVALAAAGMYIVETLYGGPVTGRVHPIVGELERPEYAVYAHYHHGFELLDAVSVLHRHFLGTGGDVADFLDAMVADMFSDAVYGNGRFADSTDGYDELRSARLVYGHARSAGYPPQRAQRLRNAVLGTAFSEATGAQAGREDPDPVVAAVAGIDLHILSTRASVAAAIELAIENGCSARFSADRVLGVAAAEAGLRLRDTAAALAFIDSRPALREWLARTLRGNALFTATIYQYPLGWTLEDSGVRTANAALQHELADGLESGELSATEAYAHAQAHKRSSRAADHGTCAHD